MGAITMARQSLCSRTPSSLRSRRARTAIGSSTIAQITAGSQLPSVMLAIEAGATPVKRIPVATAGTITPRAASSVMCEGVGAGVAVETTSAEGRSAMSLMNLPGFTAEESLHELRDCYVMIGEVAGYGGHDEIVPQAPIVLDGFCIGNGRYCCFKINGRWWCGASTQA